MTNQIVSQGYIGSNSIVTQGYSLGELQFRVKIAVSTKKPVKIAVSTNKKIKIEVED